MNKRTVFTAAVVLILLAILFNFNPLFIISSLSSRATGYRCPDGVIPFNLTLSFRKENGQTWLGLDSERSLWADGSVVQWDVSKALELQADSPTGTALFCRQGNVTGENINQYYCYNLYYAKTVQNVSVSGEIGEKKTDRFNVDLVLGESSWVTDISGPFASTGYVTFRVISAKCKPVR